MAKDLDAVLAKITKPKLPKVIQRDNFRVKSVVTQQHLEVNVDLRIWSTDTEPFSSDQTIILVTAIKPGQGLAWSTMHIEIHRSAKMAEAKNGLADIGFVEGLQETLRVLAFWPPSAFDSVVPLVAANRIVAVDATMTPIKYRQAQLQGLQVSTRSEKQFHEHFELLHGRDRRRATKKAKSD